jgi:hypothetical protein
VTVTHLDFNPHCVSRVSEYLEDFIARVDASLLDSINVAITVNRFHQLIFDIPQLAQFIGRASMFQELKEVHVQFRPYVVLVETLPPPLAVTLGKRSGLKIGCRESHWQISSAPRVFTSFFPSIYMVERLYIHGPQYCPRYGSYDTDYLRWLEILHPFTAVRKLYLVDESAHHIAPALQELVGGRTMEVLPMLQSIFLVRIRPLGRSVPEGIQKFVAARQLSGNPITISIREEVDD